MKQSEWEVPLGQSFRIAKPLCSRRVVDLFGVLWAASAAARYQILMVTWCGLVDCEQSKEANDGNDIVMVVWWLKDPTSSQRGWLLSSKRWWPVCVNRCLPWL